MLMSLAATLIVLEEGVRPRNWFSLSRLDKALVLIAIATIVTSVVGTVAFIWGV
jgi:membrane-associated PAP2 superfamily phosphatase